MYNLPKVRPALCRPWYTVYGKPPTEDQVWYQLCQRILLRSTPRSAQTTRAARQRLPRLGERYRVHLWTHSKVGARMLVLTWDGPRTSEIFYTPDSTPTGRCLPVRDADAAEVDSWYTAKQSFDEGWGNVACGLMMRCLVRECIEESQPAMKTERRDLFDWQGSYTPDDVPPP